MRKLFYLLLMLPGIAWAQISLSPSVAIPSSGKLTIVGTGGTATLSGGQMKLVNTTAGNVTINLPTAVGKSGQTIVVKKVSTDVANYAAVTPNGAELIDGSNAAYRLYTPNESITIVSDGSQWRVTQHMADFVNANENWTDNQSNATSTARIVTRSQNRLCVVGVTEFTSTASGNIEVTIPTEYTPSSAAYPRNNSEIMGLVRFTDAATATYDGFVQLSAANTINFGVGVTSSTYLNPAGANATIPFTWNTGDFLDWKVCWVVGNWRP